MRFNFTGKLGFNSLDSKNPYLRTGKTKSGDKYSSLNLSVIAAKNNRGYCEMFGAEKDTIITWDKDGNRVEVPWDERFEENDSARKFILSLNSQRNEYIAEKDFIDEFVSQIESLENKRFTVTGDIRKEVYNGKIRDRFQIRNIYDAKEGSANSLGINGVIYYTKNSVDLSDWRKEKKIVINGYVKQYIDKNNGTKFIPQQIVFDCSKVNFENETHVSQVEARLSVLGLELADGEIKNNLKSKSVYRALVDIRYHNGAEEVEFDESMLTPMQRKQIKCGNNTIDDFRTNGNAYGDRITEYKYINGILRGEYDNGAVEDEMTLKEFEEQIYEPVIDEKFEEAMNEPEDDDEEDIFS